MLLLLGILLDSTPCQAQRNELNAKVRMLREELQHLQEQCSYVGEVREAGNGEINLQQSLI